MRIGSLLSKILLPSKPWSQFTFVQKELQYSQTLIEVLYAHLFSSSFSHMEKPTQRTRVVNQTFET